VIGEITGAGVRPSYEDALLLAAEEKDAADFRALRERLVGRPLQRHRLSAPPRLILRDQDLAAHMPHPARERVAPSSSS
jgi:hypothetical protein